MDHGLDASLLGLGLGLAHVHVVDLVLGHPHCFLLIMVMIIIQSSLDMIYRGAIITRMRISLHLSVLAVLLAVSRCQNFSQVTLRPDPESSQSLPSIRLAQQSSFMVPLSQLLPDQPVSDLSSPPSLSPLLHIGSRQRSDHTCSLTSSYHGQGYEVIAEAKHHPEQWPDPSQPDIAARIENIGKFKNVADVESIPGHIVVLFWEGELAVYQVTEGQIRQKGRVQVGAAKAMQLVAGRGHVLLVTGDKVGLVRVEPSVGVVEMGGYGKLSGRFKARIGEGQEGSSQLSIMHQGVSIYKYKVDYGNNSLHQIGEYSFTYHLDTRQLLHFIDFLEIQGRMHLLSPELGLLTAPLPATPLAPSRAPLRCQSTALSQPDCLFLQPHKQSIFVSCPELRMYSPATDSVSLLSSYSQVPQQMISTHAGLLALSDNTLELVDACARSVQPIRIGGHYFDRSASVDGGRVFASVNDVDIVLWRLKYPRYYVKCYGAERFEGLNKLTLGIKNQCDGQAQCCTRQHALLVQIYDSKKGLHLFEIVAGTALLVLAAVAGAYVLVSRRNLAREYAALNEEVMHLKTSTEDTMVEDKSSDKHAQMQLQIVQ